MKSSTCSLLATALLAALGATGVAQAQTPPPYVETTSLTFIWNFSDTFISTTTQAISDVGTGQLDPELLTGDDPISTDTGVAEAYSPTGNQTFFIQRILQALIRNKGFDLNGDDFIRDEEDEEPEVVRAAQIDRAALPLNWQLIAVREVPRTVAELATNPYKLYISVIDRVRGSGNIPVDELSAEEPPDRFDESLPLGFRLINTGMTLTLGQWAATGVTTESYTDDIVTAATGKVTTAFRLDFGAVYYDDPRHSRADNPPPALNTYHLKRNVWSMSATGHLTYNIRSIPAAAAAHSSDLPLAGSFVATNVNMTGTGQFIHAYRELDDKFVEKDNFFTFAGLAPLKVKMGNIQYQNRNLFPDFNPAPAP